MFKKKSENINLKSIIYTLSIIIVSYKTEKITLQTIKSVIDALKASPLLKNQTEVILVDNNSQDQTIDKAHEQLSLHNLPFQIIANRENLGFTKANNMGIKLSQGKYVLLLNSDTVVGKKSLMILVKTFNRYAVDERLGILAPLLLNPDKTIQAQGGDFPSLISVFCQMSFLDDLPIIGKYLPSTQHSGKNQAGVINFLEHKVIFKNWIAGTAMMIRRQVIEEIGLLDENIFMYGEDIEYCLRAKHHHWKAAINPEALIIHLGSASSCPTNAIIGEFKSYLYIWSKHKPYWQKPLIMAILKLGASLRIWLYRYFKPNNNYVKVYQHILREVLR